MTDVPRGTLAPGDLCVIIDHTPMDAFARPFVGRTVVLIDIVWSVFGPHSPYWHCAGIPPTTIVSYEVLRKIPPDRMLDARTHIESEDKPEEVTI